MPCGSALLGDRNVWHSVGLAAHCPDVLYGAACVTAARIGTVCGHVLRVRRGLGGLDTPLLHAQQHALVVLMLGREFLRPLVPAKALAALYEPAATERAAP